MSDDDEEVVMMTPEAIQERIVQESLADYLRFSFLFLPPL